MTKRKKIKVLVLMGGPSAEHEVSLNTGQEILKTLDTRKYLTEPVLVTKGGQWLPPPRTIKVIGKDPDQHPMLIKNATRPDVAFIAMHGTYGEDGTMQGLLETIDIPYTGSGILASALGMDKPRSCSIFREAGFNVPEFTILTCRDLRSLHNACTFPLVVKPANHGSSIGVHIVKNKGELRTGLRDAFRYSDRVMIQKFIKGREITCGVLEKNGKLFPLPPTEIIPKKGAFYDYKSKYDEGGSEHLTPPPNLSGRIIKMVQNAACRAHQVIGCSGMSRSDFILTKNNKLYILEINTIPGMTHTSLLPEAARAANISFPRLLDLLIKNALEKPRRR